MRRKNLSFAVFFLLFSLILQAQDSKQESNFRLAIKLYEDKLYDLALEQFQQLIVLYPNTKEGIDSRFYIGLCQFQLKKFDESKITFQNFAISFNEHPRAPEAWWKAGEAAVEMQQFKEAALTFERLYTFHRQSNFASQALFRSGELFYQCGEIENAKRNFQRLTQEFGASGIVTDARLRLTNILLFEHRYELARAEAKRIIEGTKEPSKKAQGYLLLAEAYLSLEMVSEAKAAFTEIVKNFRILPYYYNALFSLGILNKQEGNITEAISNFRSITDDSLKTSEDIRQRAFLELGHIYFFVLDYKKALSFYIEASRLRSTKTCEAFYFTGKMYELLKNFQLALQNYEGAYRDTSNRVANPLIAISILRTAREIKNFERSISIANEFRSLYPNDEDLPYIIFTAAEIHRIQIKDAISSLVLYDEIIKNSQSNEFIDDALFGKANALAQTGEFEKALSIYNELLNRFPASEYYSKAIQECEIIELFEYKQRETGLSNLASLMSDIIGGKRQGELALRLADIYFSDLKDYDRAASHYLSVLSLINEPTVAAKVWFRLAKSYEYLSLKFINGEVNARYTSEAIAAYDSLLNKYPISEYYDNAMSSRSLLLLKKAESLQEIKDIAFALVTAKPVVQSIASVVAKASEELIEKNDYEAAGTLIRVALERDKKTVIGGELNFRLHQAELGMSNIENAYSILLQMKNHYPGSPFVPKALLLIAERFSFQKRKNEALAMYDELESKYNYSPLAKNLALNRADVYFNSSDWNNAALQYKRFLFESENQKRNIAEIPTEIYFRLGVCNEKLNRTKESKKYYHLFLLREPSTQRASAVLFTLGNFARKGNKYDEAAKYFQESSRLRAQSGTEIDNAKLAAAELLFKSERYAEAVTKFSEVVQQVKNDSTLLMYLQSRIVICYYRLGNIKEAEKRKESFVKRYSTALSYRLEFEYERGMHNLRKEDYDKSIEQFGFILTNYPDASIVPEALYALGRVYLAKQNTQKAIQLFDSLIRTYATHSIISRVQLALGNLYYKMEQWDAAGRLYKAILDSEQRDPEMVQFALSNLIMVYKELGLYDAALQLTRQYIERYPDDPENIQKKIDIGILLQKLGYYDQAINHLQHLLDGAEPDLEAEVRYYIGESYHYKGEYQQAILEFLKIPYLVTKRTKADWISTAYYMAGQAYEKMSKYEQAITMYQKIIERPGVGTEFKTAAQKEINRVNSLLQSGIGKPER